jgi:hypothetical protein
MIDKDQVNPMIRRIMVQRNKFDFDPFTGIVFYYRNCRKY